MHESLRWSISFYEKDRYARPVKDFLQQLSRSEYEQVNVAISRLSELNITAREPLVRHVKGKLWELRARSHANTYRLIYVLWDGQIVFLHGFLKKTRKTSHQEIEIARVRYQDLLKRQS